MPIVVIGTLDESGQTNLGPYSLCFPYYVVGQDQYAMLLITRNNSNTAKNILRTRKCSLNFITHEKKYLKNVVTIGFPGDTTAEKMPQSIFSLMDGLLQEENPTEKYPKIVEEAFQVFECTWDTSLDGAENDTVQEEYLPPYHQFNGITSAMGAHFILTIERILMKPKFKQVIIQGVKFKSFPKIPVDYGYRDNTNFWLAQFKKPQLEEIPKNKVIRLDTIRYAADRIDPAVKFTKDACSSLIKVPRIFLNKALQGCVSWAKERGIALITEAHKIEIRDKRSQEK